MHLAGAWEGGVGRNSFVRSSPRPLTIQLFYYLYV